MKNFAFHFYTMIFACLIYTCNTSKTLAQKDFESKDFIFINEKGGSVSLLRYKGKYIFIETWTTWCSPCIGRLDSLEQVKTKLEDKIVFINLNINNDKSKWLTFMGKRTFSGENLWADYEKKPLCDIIVDTTKGFYSVKPYNIIVFDKRGRLLPKTSEAFLKQFE